MGGCKSNMGQRPPCGNSQRAFPRDKTIQTERVQIPETEWGRTRLTKHAEPRFPCSVCWEELGLMLLNIQRHESTNSFFPVLKAVGKRSLSAVTEMVLTSTGWERCTLLSPRQAFPQMLAPLPFPGQRKQLSLTVRHWHDSPTDPKSTWLTADHPARSASTGFSVVPGMYLSGSISLWILHWRHLVFKTRVHHFLQNPSRVTCPPWASAPYF